MSRARAELRLVIRETPLIPATLALVALMLLAVWNGDTWLRARERVVADAVEASRAWHARLDRGFARIARGKPAPSLDPRDPGLANYLSRPLAMAHATPLGLLAPAPLDGTVPAHRITDRRLDAVEDEELRNPTQLLTGRFDVDFLLVVLLPWFAMALGHGLVSVERERGRLPLLASATSRPDTALTWRAAWIVLTLTLGAAAGLFGGLAACGRLGAVTVGAAATLLLLLLSVLSTWMLLSLAIGALGRSSSFNLATLACAWVVLCWVVPIALSEVGTRRHPVSSDLALAQARRRISYVTWENRADRVPAMLAHLGIPLDAIPADRRGELPLMAYYHAFQSGMAPLLAEATDRRRQRTRFDAWSSIASPATATRAALLRVAGASPGQLLAASDAEQGRAEADAAFRMRAVVEGRRLTRADYLPLHAPLVPPAPPLPAAPLAAVVAWCAIALAVLHLLRRRATPVVGGGAPAPLETS